MKNITIQVLAITLFVSIGTEHVHASYANFGKSQAATHQQTNSTERIIPPRPTNKPLVRTLEAPSVNAEYLDFAYRGNNALTSSTGLKPSSSTNTSSNVIPTAHITGEESLDMSTNKSTQPPLPSTPAPEEHPIQFRQELPSTSNQSILTPPDMPADLHFAPATQRPSYSAPTKEQVIRQFGATSVPTQKFDEPVQAPSTNSSPETSGSEQHIQAQDESTLQRQTTTTDNTQETIAHNNSTESTPIQAAAQTPKSAENSSTPKTPQAQRTTLQALSNKVFNATSKAGRLLNLTNGSQKHTVTDPVSKITTVETTDAAGRVIATKVTDAVGQEITTNYTYNATTGQKQIASVQEVRPNTNYVRVGNLNNNKVIITTKYGQDGKVTSISAVDSAGVAIGDISGIDENGSYTIKDKSPDTKLLEQRTVTKNADGQKKTETTIYNPDTTQTIITEDEATPGVVKTTERDASRSVNVTTIENRNTGLTTVHDEKNNTATMTTAHGEQVILQADNSYMIKSKNAVISVDANGKIIKTANSNSALAQRIINSAFAGKKSGTIADAQDDGTFKTKDIKVSFDTNGNLQVTLQPKEGSTNLHPIKQTISKIDGSIKTEQVIDNNNGTKKESYDNGPDFETRSIDGKQFISVIKNADGSPQNTVVRDIKNNSLVVTKNDRTGVFGRNITGTTRTINLDDFAHAVSSAKPTAQGLSDAIDAATLKLTGANNIISRTTMDKRILQDPNYQEFRQNLVDSIMQEKSNNFVDRVGEFGKRMVSHATLGTATRLTAFQSGSYKAAKAQTITENNTSAQTFINGHNHPDLTITTAPATGTKNGSMNITIQSDLNRKISKTNTSSEAIINELQDGSGSVAYQPGKGFVFSTLSTAAGSKLAQGTMLQQRTINPKTGQPNLTARPSEVTLDPGSLKQNININENDGVKTTTTIAKNGKPVSLSVAQPNGSIKVYFADSTGNLPDVTKLDGITPSQDFDVNKMSLKTNIYPRNFTWANAANNKPKDNQSVEFKLEDMIPKDNNTNPTINAPSQESPTIITPPNYPAPKPPVLARQNSASSTTSTDSNSSTSSAPSNI